MSEAPWYYTRGGERQGPVAQADLQQRIAAGQVAPGELVWRAGMANWQPAHGVPELMPQGAPPPVAGATQIGYYAANPAYGHPRPPSIGDDAGIRMLLPVGRSGWAIAAGYLGLLSVLLLPAPVALIISLLAIRDIRRDSTKHGMGRAVFGLIMGIIFTGLLIFVGIINLTHR